MENTIQPEEKIIEAKPEVATEVQETKTKPVSKMNGIVITLLVVLVVVLAAAVFILYKQANAVSIQAVPAETESSVSPTTETTDTTNWKTYSDNKAGFSFKYPDTILVNEETKNSEKIVVSVSADKLSEISEDLPLSMGRGEALKEKARLASGEGEGLVKIGDLYGQISTTLAQYEVCSVMFSKKLVFYPGEYRVILTLIAPKNIVIAEMPEFFTTDTENCGTEKIWDFDRMTEFETTLENNKGTGKAQEWHNTFSGIMSTVELITPAPTAAVEGTLYTNEKYGFELTYDAPYKLLNDKDNLYGYPNGVALLYKGGQAYDIVIEAWDSQQAYEQAHSGNLANITAFESKGKFITFYNNTESPDNKEIINSVTILP